MQSTHARVAHLCFTCSLLLAGAGSASYAQPNDGIDWVTIGDVNNPALNLGTLLDGRGSVAWQYRLGRTEVTTAQWAEFLSAVEGRETPLEVPGVRSFQPLRWGAELDPTYDGPGLRYRASTTIPNSSMFAVSGLSWRAAAVYCNWLHNGKSMDPAAFQNGAYDTSTFGRDADLLLTDQVTHHPDAKYWIPSIDEWQKAAFYDPNRFGPGQGGWWHRQNRSDADLVYGVPGVGQANAGFRLPGDAEELIPLGFYPSVASAYGLLDSAGGLSEWVEGTQFRSDGIFMGSARASFVGSADDVGWGFLRPPEVGGYDSGVRLASSIPSPGCIWVCTCCLLFDRPRNRKRMRQKS